MLFVIFNALRLGYSAPAQGYPGLLFEKAFVLVGYNKRAYLRHVAAFREAYDFIHIIRTYFNEPCCERIAVIDINNRLKKAHSDASD